MVFCDSFTLPQLLIFNAIGAAAGGDGQEGKLRVTGGWQNAAPSKQGRVWETHLSGTDRQREGGRMQRGRGRAGEVPRWLERGQGDWAGRRHDCEFPAKDGREFPFRLVKCQKGAPHMVDTRNDTCIQFFKRPWEAICDVELIGNRKKQILQCTELAWRHGALC